MKRHTGHLLFFKANLCYLLDTHPVELLLPVFRVAVMVVRRWCEMAENAGVPLVAEVSQMSYVELELAAVLGQG